MKCSVLMVNGRKRFGQNQLAVSLSPAFMLSYANSLLAAALYVQAEIFAFNSQEESL